MASKVLLEEEKNLGGRPPIILTDEQKNTVQQMAKVSTVQQIADYLGISRTAFFEILRRDEEVSSHYKKGRIQAKKIMGNSLFKRGVAGDTTAAIFYMKTQGGWKEPKDEDIKELRKNGEI